MVLVAGAVMSAQTPLGARGGPDSAKELVVEGRVVGHRVEAQPGDRCLLCSDGIHAGDAVYLINGHRVGIHAGKCDNAFRANPAGTLAVLQPRGAFLGGEPGKDGQSQVWFFGGLYVLAGLLCGALCAHRALNAGYSTIGWFLAGFFFNAVGYLALLTRPRRADWAPPAGIPAGLGKIAATYAPQACACGATNHPSAGRCTGCGAALSPHVASEVNRAGAKA